MRLRHRSRLRNRSAIPLFVGLCLAAAALPQASPAQTSVLATVETDPVPNANDAADDPAVWVHPTNRASSLIFGTDKIAAIVAYDLSGAEVQYLVEGQINNIEVRYGFELGGQVVDIVAGSNRSNDTIEVWSIDPSTGFLTNVTVPGGIATGITVYGFCMYRSTTTGLFYGYVTAKNGEVEQYELTDDGSGAVEGTLVRSFDVGTQVEGCVADDELDQLYIGEENVALWRYGAGPADGSARTLIDTVGTGNLTADIEGLSLYYTTAGTGYLIASSQGANEFNVYDRTGTNAYLGKFDIVDGPTIDGAADTDGIVVTSANLGPAFPSGLFAAQDCCNGSDNQNFKVVPWQDIATPMGLQIDATFDPRSLLPACANGLDDDADGTVDLADVGCKNAGVNASESPACNDGQDNDGDGGFDFDGGLAALGYVLGPPDPQCVDPYRGAEAQACGVGVELAPGLALLLLLRRRRR